MYQLISPDFMISQRIYKIYLKNVSTHLPCFYDRLKSIENEFKDCTIFTITVFLYYCFSYHTRHDTIGRECL